MELIMASVACCNFPTTLMVLDDDVDFLESIRKFMSKKYKCICFSDTDKARDTLLKDRGWTNALLKEGGVERVYTDEAASLFTVGTNIWQLKEQVYNPDRFKNIAIAIVDYDMPNINGLEFVRSLEDSQLKVIMLTGKAGQGTVIKAFNDKEIHRYVSKGDPEYLQKIQQYINELQTEFFFDFSKFILDSIKQSENKVFDNKSYIDLFNKTIRENEIVEYYLLDESGSFLMLDASAQNQVWFIVKSKANIDHFYELASNEGDMPTDVVEKLKNYKLLTQFKAKKEESADTKSWHFAEAHPLDEKKEYFYAILKNDKRFQMERSRIKSYQEFLKQK